ncbi:MAG: GNAT family N-acetyltransferase [Planctomycetota bacterium]
MPTTHLQAWRDRGRPRPAIVCDFGTRADFDALAPLHYRAGPPATIDRIVRAIDTEHDALAGVLVTSRPTLNGSWRGRAWNDAFASGSRSADARRINAQLRTISRVIVDPRFRGLGVGSGLVRHYLAAPATRCTEAITALGDVCPFFERAGMRPVTIPCQPRNTRLLRALGTDDPMRAAETLVRQNEEFEDALRRWARTNASTRRLADGDVSLIATAAVGAMLAPPMAYVHGDPSA